MEQKIIDMWFDSCFQEDLINPYGDSVYVLRNTNETTVAGEIYRELEKQNDTTSITKIIDLRPR